MRSWHAAAHRFHRVLHEQSRVIAQVVGTGKQPAGFGRGNLGQDLAAFVLHRQIREVHQFVGCQRLGGGHRHILDRAIEYFSGGRITHIGNNDDVAAIQARADGLRIHLAHRAGVLEIRAVANAIRLGGDEIARHRVDRRARHR